MSKTPICIVSYNRSFYLDSLLHSLEDELDDFDVIVVDNNSNESNMKNVIQKWSSKIQTIFLQGGDWINDEYKAKNAFLDHFNLNYQNSSNCLFLQDDMQYIGPKKHLKDIIKDIEKTDFLNVSLTGVRKCTVKSTYSNLKYDNVWQTRDNHFTTTGFYRKSTFNEIGKYAQSFPIEKSYWGRGEDDYNSRVINKFGSNSKIAGYYHVPPFVGVWNDPRGHYSFIRDNERFGYYLPPVNSKTYYQNLDHDTFKNLMSRKEPASFVDIAKPIGWEYAKTPDGDQLKYSQSTIMIEGPRQLIK